jgi:hypothetical protein
MYGALWAAITGSGSDKHARKEDKLHDNSEDEQHEPHAQHENIETPAFRTTARMTASDVTTGNSIPTKLLALQKVGPQTKRTEERFGTYRYDEGAPGDDRSKEKASTPNGGELHENLKPCAKQTSQPHRTHTVRKRGLPLARKRKLAQHAGTSTKMPGQPFAERAERDAELELDAELRKLSTMATRFFSSQGIRTPEEFLTAEPTISDALIAWINQEGSSRLKCSDEQAKRCIHNWKSQLRQNIKEQSEKMSVENRMTEAALMELRQTQRELSKKPAAVKKSTMPAVRRVADTNAKKKEPVIPATLVQPLIVGDDDELHHMSSYACRFLTSQGITTVEALLTIKTKTLAIALAKWRNKFVSGDFSLTNAENSVRRWKRELIARQQRQKTNPVRNLVDVDADELNHLNLFMFSQDITTTGAFLSADTTSLAIAMVEWREREKMLPLTPAEALTLISKWKSELQQQRKQPSQNDSGKKRPIVFSGLHPAFETLSKTVQTFFVQQSIATPSDLLFRDRQELARVFVQWRDQNSTRELKLGTSMCYVSEWRQLAVRHVDKATDTVECPPSHGDGTLTLAGEWSRAATESQSAQESRASSQDDTAAIRNDVGNMNQRKGSPTEVILHGIQRKDPPTAAILHGIQRKGPPTEVIHDATTDMSVPQVFVQMEQRITGTATVATSGSLPLEQDAVEKAILELRAHKPPAYKTGATIISKGDESGRTVPLKTADNHNTCEQTVGTAAALDGLRESGELSSQGGCDLRILETDAIRFLASRGITTISALYKADTNELTDALLESRKGSKTESQTYSSARQHVYRWKRILRLRQAAESQNASTPEGVFGLNVLASEDRALLAAVGITTAEAFLNQRGSSLGHALVEARQRLHMKPWAFSTARQVLCRWASLVRPKQPLPVADLGEQLEEQLEEEVVALDPVFDSVSPWVRSFLAAQSITTAHDLLLRNNQDLSKALQVWKRQKRRVELKSSSANIYIGRWKMLARRHAEATETAAACSLTSDDTTTGAGQQGTNSASSIGKSNKIKVPGNGHRQRNDIDGDVNGDGTNDTLYTTNALESAQVIAYPRKGSAPVTTTGGPGGTHTARVAMEEERNIDNDSMDTSTATESVLDSDSSSESSCPDDDDTVDAEGAWAPEQNEPQTSGKLFRKVAKRTFPWATQPPRAPTTHDGREVPRAPTTHDGREVQNVVTEHAESGDFGADRKRKRPRTENTPDNVESGKEVASIAPFVPNLRTYSYW